MKGNNQGNNQGGKPAWNQNKPDQKAQPGTPTPQGGQRPQNNPQNPQQGRPQNNPQNPQHGRPQNPQQGKPTQGQPNKQRDR